MVQKISPAPLYITLPQGKKQKKHTCLMIFMFFIKKKKRQTYKMVPKWSPAPHPHPLLGRKNCHEANKSTKSRRLRISMF